MRSDTSPGAVQAQIRAYRQLGAARRLELAFLMSAFVREMAYQRIRNKAPHADELSVRHALIWEQYGLRVGSS